MSKDSGEKKTSALAASSSDCAAGDLTPGEVELEAYFRAHLGPRTTSAGVRIQFRYNQTPGIHFKVEPVEVEYRRAILRGLEDGMACRFPMFPKTGSIWITGIREDHVESSQHAFYIAARMAIDEAYSMVENRLRVHSAFQS